MGGMSKWMPETNPSILRRIGKTDEEIHELGKVLARIIIQGMAGVDPSTGVPNRAALTDEIADVYAQLDETVEMFELDSLQIQLRRKVKREQMKEWEQVCAQGDS